MSKSNKYVQKIKLPHQEPIKFAKYIIKKELNKAKVKVEFDEVPSLALLIEGAAQSSAALGDAEDKNAYLVSLRDVNLLKKAELKSFEIEVKHEFNLENMNSISFNVFENKRNIASGSFVIAIS